MPDLLEQYKADPAEVALLASPFHTGEPVKVSWQGGRNLLIVLDVWRILFDEQTPLIGGEYMLGDYSIKVVDWSAQRRLVLVQRID